MFERILFAAKEIEAAHPALDYVRDIAGNHRSEVLVLHVGEVAEDQTALAKKIDPNAEGNVRASEAEKRAQSRTQADRIVEELADDGISARTVARTGRIAGEILAAAAEENADLIVIGTAGRAKLTAMLTGSVVDEVVRKASRPVLVVPLHPAAERGTG